MSETQVHQVEVGGPVEGRYEEVLTPGALSFLEGLHREFNPRRLELLEKRTERRKELLDGGTLDFLEETKDVREGDWSVAEVPKALRERKVEITGPTSAKMVINALNSGASGFMADFEDSNSPTWDNMIGGQLNLADAIRRKLEFTSEEGKEYSQADEQANLLVRPRGWHLPERHLKVDGEEMSGSLVDFGLYVFHNSKELIERGAGPFYYLPKMEHHLEARLWADVFRHAEDKLDLDTGTIKATVLIETIPAAFQMDEILYELRDHSAGLNAGRWDYIFSMIKCFGDREDKVLPDRTDVTMTVPFMRAYTELLVKTCHRRGAHAMGGMAAVIPSRTDEEANEKAFEAVKADKKREAEAGYDGTWVAHPDSVEVAMGEFDAVLGDRPNQLDKQRDDVEVSAEELLDAGSAGDSYTRKGLDNDVNVGIQYISSWLRGNGAAGIYGMMEDAATAEIARYQVWQWLKHGIELDTGEKVTPELVGEVATEQLEVIRKEIGDDEWFEREGRPELSRELFEKVALADDPPAFLTLPAYEELLKIHDA
ncbi:malate synthase A [Thermoleophilia bacterium SCSIO 60948]|nr:malate synthase A [Thermoleophilia bacterium SCSIO 60948]